MPRWCHYRFDDAMLRRRFAAIISLSLMLMFIFDFLIMIFDSTLFSAHIIYVYLRHYIDALVRMPLIDYAAIIYAFHFISLFDYFHWFSLSFSLRHVISTFAAPWFSFSAASIRFLIFSSLISFIAFRLMHFFIEFSSPLMLIDFRCFSDASILFTPSLFQHHTPSIIDAAHTPGVSAQLPVADAVCRFCHANMLFFLFYGMLYIRFACAYIYSVSADLMHITLYTLMLWCQQARSAR